MIRYLASADYQFPPPIEIAPDAREDFADFIAQVNALKDIPGASAAWKGHAAKWEKFSARLILVFHAVDQFSVFGEVDPRWKVRKDTVRRALTFGRFMLRHQLNFYNSFLDPDTAQAETTGFAGYLLAHPKMTEIKRRDVYQARGALKGAQNRRALVQVTRSLEEAGWLQVTERDGEGAAAWRVNPRIHIRFNARGEFERVERARKQEAIRKAGIARKALEQASE